MRKIVVVEHLTLDGVMQAPGRPDEDRRDGFAHGGWAASRNDDVMAAELGGGMGGAELLFGRVTYADFAAYWPHAPQPNPFTEVLNQTHKYVASRTLSEPLSWANSTLLAGDAGDAVAGLKATPGKDLAVLGSGDLVRTLMRHDLADKYLLLIYPLVLGTGRRLFPDGCPPANLRLARSAVTTTGVVIATYEPVRSGG